MQGKDIVLVASAGFFLMAGLEFAFPGLSQFFWWPLFRGHRLFAYLDILIGIALLTVWLAWRSGLLQSN